MVRRVFGKSTCRTVEIGFAILHVVERAKKLVSVSLGLIDFAVGLVDLIIHFLNGQVKHHANENFLGLVKMTFRLVHPGKENLISLHPVVDLQQLKL